MSIRIGAYSREQGADADSLTAFPQKLITDDAVTIARVKSAVVQAILDGYRHVVYNFVRCGNSQIAETDRC